MLKGILGEMEGNHSYSAVLPVDITELVAILFRSDTGEAGNWKAKC